MRFRFATPLAGAVLASHLILSTAAAQAPVPQPGPYARMVVIQPHAGQATAFEAGYQRHLEWHRGAQDRWTWYGWNFVLGDRLGKFMDGTFFHAAEDFDDPVRPADDGADNVRNVEPYADFESHGIYERLASVSAGAPLPDTAPYLAMTTYFVAPGAAPRFEEILRAQARAQPAGSRFSWYRMTVGGEAPAYVLLRAVPSFGAAAHLTDWFAGARPPAATGVVTRVRAELLRYAPKMSYHPEG
ncbi:hypothetical protein E4L96_17950 [Massilia arenosa]|uniref:NIPSNAP family protein n=1 Tax=Zemynaea arenosa TaxID=2561931 RepID=A0A4Y9S376_9BURK|nr:hypothetical protein [Massilia arenosa]TFW15635.1 hypothetical protein E4L96_17950 [Massilia arenosa]